MPSLFHQRRSSGRDRAGVVRRPAFELLEDRDLLALLIDPGSLVLLPDTPGQTIPIYVSRSAPATDPLVTGFNLRAQLGDGLGSAAEPVFQSVQFGGGIWNAYSNTIVGGPVAGNAQFAQASVLFNAPGQSVAAEGLIATLVVSTVGFTSGEYELRLASTGIGADSEFIGAQGASIPATISVGTLQIGDRPWQNSVDRFDVNADSRVTPLDVLIVINNINAEGIRVLPLPAAAPPYLDINGDGSCTPEDVLQVVNLLNALSANLYPQAALPGTGPAEGEPLMNGDSAAAVGDKVGRPAWLLWPAAGEPLQEAPPASGESLRTAEARDDLFAADLELGLDPALDFAL